MNNKELIHFKNVIKFMCILNTYLAMLQYFPRENGRNYFLFHSIKIHKKYIYINVNNKMEANE